MFEERILLAVSIASALISAISTIWGLLRETSVKDDAGVKRLTSAGQVSIALAVGGALLAVTSLGLKEIVASQKAAAASEAEARNRLLEQQATFERERRERERDRESRRIALENSRWQDQRSRDALRQNEAVLASQRLLAAVEEQRDAANQAQERLFQIAQSQRIILETQPLRSLDVALTLGGLSDAEFSALEDSASSVSDRLENDDEFGRAAPNDPELYNAALLESLLGSAIRPFTEPPDDFDAELDDRFVFLVIDLSGDGEWLLPVGVVESGDGKGFWFSEPWLAERSDPYGSAEGQQFAGCRVPAMSLDGERRSVLLRLSIPGPCLSNAVHMQGNTATARLSEAPRIAVFRGNRNFPDVVADLMQLDPEIRNGCFRNSGLTQDGKYLELQVVPNGTPLIGITQTLHFSGGAEMADENYYDGRLVKGTCASFR